MIKFFFSSKKDVSDEIVLISSYYLSNLTFSWLKLSIQSIVVINSLSHVILLFDEIIKT